METPYSRITEIKEAGTPEEANDLLKQGFILVKVMERYTNDTERQFSNIVYVLGRQQVQRREPFRTSTERTPPATTRRQHRPRNPREAPLEEVRQRRRRVGLLHGQGREPASRARRSARLIERMKGGEEMTVGNYTYRIKDKFLKRFPVDGAQE